MLDETLQFFRPTKTLRELFTLLSLEERQHISQHELGRRIGTSSAMAHNYMKDMIGRGMITVSGDTNRSMQYAVTQKGRARLAVLMRVYSKEIARFYSIAKREVEQRLHELCNQGMTAVVLFGAAETGELVYNAAKSTRLRIVGWVDNDVMKHGLFFGDLCVGSPDTIESCRPDGVLIASSGNTDEIVRQLHHLPEKGIPIVTV